MEKTHLESEKIYLFQFLSFDKNKLKKIKNEFDKNEYWKDFKCSDIKPHFNEHFLIEIESKKEFSYNDEKIQKLSYKKL